MLLVKHGVWLQVPVLVTSLIRLRNGREWYQSGTSKRILDRKSLVKLNVEVINDDIAVKFSNILITLLKYCLQKANG